MAKIKRNFRVESCDYGITIFGQIRTEQLIAILDTYESDDLEMIPDASLAQKMDAVLAIPWNEEMLKKWHEEVDLETQKRPKEAGVVVPLSGSVGPCDAS